jgi:hypothetical protein
VVKEERKLFVLVIIEERAKVRFAMRKRLRGLLLLDAKANQTEKPELVLLDKRPTAPDPAI